MKKVFIEKLTFYVCALNSALSLVMLGGLMYLFGKFFKAMLMIPNEIFSLQVLYIALTVNSLYFIGIAILLWSSIVWLRNAKSILKQIKFRSILSLKSVNASP